MNGKVSVTSSSSPSLSDGMIKKIILTYTYILIWLFFSFSVIIYNKYILDKKLYNWPFPVSLTMIHMLFSSCLSFLLVRVFRVVEPPVHMTKSLYISSVVPIGVLFALSLWLSNSAYIYLSVSFIQMLKALMPVIVYCIGVLLKKDVFRTNTMVNMVSISVGVGIAAYGEAKFDLYGVILQLSALLFEATRLVLIQILLTSKGIQLNPITSLYYIAPCCLVCLSIPWLLVEFPVLVAKKGAFEVDVVVFGTNSLIAFGLNLAVFLLVGKTSALTMNVAGVVKDWLLIGFSWSVIKDTVTPVNLLGYLLAFLGVVYYNRIKYQNMKAAEAQKSKKVVSKIDDEESANNKKLIHHENGGDNDSNDGSNHNNKKDDDS